MKSVSRNFKVLGRDVEVFYKDKGWCRGRVESMTVSFPGEGEYAIGGDEPYRFC